jgi:protein TonB
VRTSAGGGLASLEGLEAVWGARRPRGRGAAIGTVVALGLHVVVAATLVHVDASRLFHAEQTVEMDVQEPPPPPPDVKPEPPPPPPPPEVKPRVIVHHAPAIPPPEAPPPTAEEPPKGEAPPTFGVSLDSTVAGDGPGMAVPVGNSLMTKPHKAAPPAPPKPVGDPDGLAPAVSELSIAVRAEVLEEVKADYPPELARMGMEGQVIAKMYIDETGKVRRIRIAQSTNHGFDEAARQALLKFKFSPARTSDGKAVPVNINYTYTFETPK